MSERDFSEQDGKDTAEAADLFLRGKRQEVEPVADESIKIRAIRRHIAQARYPHSSLGERLLAVAAINILLEDRAEGVIYAALESVYPSSNESLSETEKPTKYILENNFSKSIRRPFDPNFFKNQLVVTHEEILEKRYPKNKIIDSRNYFKFPENFPRSGK